MLAADCGLLLAAIFWGFSFAAMKGALDAFPTFWVLAMRFMASFLILYSFLGHRFIGAPKQLYKLGLITGLFMFAGFAAQTYGLNFTASGKQAFLTSIYVILVPLLTWAITRVFPGKISMIASLICCLGMWFLTSDDLSSFNMGDAFTLLSVIFYAGHIMMIGYSTKHVDPILFATLQIGLVGVLSLATALTFETWTGFNGMDGIFEIGFAVLFPTIGAFLLQNVSQKYTTATHAALIMSLEGVFGVAAGIYFLSEPFTFRMGIGCALILLAVVISELRGSTK